MGEIQGLARFVAGLRYEDLPAVVVEKTKVLLLHNLAMAAAGTDGGVSAARYLQVAHLHDPDGATSFFTGNGIPVQEAAFVNSLLFHSRAQDDVNPIANAHIGAMVTPAALALAEWKGSGGRHLLTALVAGYEVAGTVGADFARFSTPRGFRASGLYGPIGCAAAAAVLLRLDAEATANALSLAANFSAGLNQCWIAGTSEWRVHVAQASRNGVLAALLALAGVESAPDILEGDHGFYQAYTGEPRSIKDRLEQLGTHWHTLDVLCKRFPVCGINQVPVYLLLETLKTHPITPEAVASVRVELNAYESRYPGIDFTGPFRDVGATLMSTQFCLATVLLKRGVLVSDLKRVDDRGILDLLARIEIEGRDDLPPRSCRLEIRLTSGEVIRTEIISGQHLSKLDWNTAVGVARQIQSEMFITREQFEQLVQHVAGIEEMSTVGPLISACTRYEAGHQ
jgi:2-methylcitrate dehydratase PrpD